MEERSARYCRSIAPVRLYLDDIEQVVAHMLELSSEADLVLATDRHEVSTVEGLAALGRSEVAALEIRCSANARRLVDLMVSIEPESVFLCRGGGTPAHKRVLGAIEALLLDRRRSGRWRTWLLIAAGLLGPLSAVALLLALAGLWPGTPYPGALLAGLSAALAASYGATRRWSVSRVILVERHAHRVHWEYVRGALLILALIAAMALVTMGLATLI